MIFQDSVTLGDFPAMDAGGTAIFSTLNEPYYIDYINDFIPGHFERAGLKCGNKSVSGLAKTLTFVKPSSTNGAE